MEYIVILYILINSMCSRSSYLSGKKAEKFRDNKIKEYEKYR